MMRQHTYIIYTISLLFQNLYYLKVYKQFQKYITDTKIQYVCTYCILEILIQYIVSKQSPVLCADGHRMYIIDVKLTMIVADCQFIGCRSNCPICFVIYIFFVCYKQNRFFIILVHNIMVVLFLLLLQIRPQFLNLLFYFQMINSL